MRQFVMCYLRLTLRPWRRVKQLLRGMRRGQGETMATKRNRKFLGEGRGNHDLRPKTCDV